MRDNHEEKRLVMGLVMDFFNPQLLEGAKSYTSSNNIRLDARWSVRGDWLPGQPSWDGVLHGLVDHPETTDKIHTFNLPTISLVKEDSQHSVIPDYETCATIAVDELAKFGIRHFLSINMSSRYIDLTFIKAALARVKEHEIPYQEYLWKKGYQDSIKEITQLIHTLPKPLGIALPHAAAAHSLTTALLNSGLRVPEDVSIVVIDKDPQQTSTLAPVSLTGVKLNEWHRGFIAAEVLHKLILGQKPRRATTLVPPGAIQGRASTGHIETHDPSVAKALIFLRANRNKDIAVPEVVTASGVSRRSLENSFRQILDSSIQAELRRLRIEDAKHHLEDNRLTITQIAEVCGFSTVHYFSTVFKRETGVSPKVYQAGNN